MGKKRKCQGGCRMVNKDRKIKQLDIVFEIGGKVWHPLS